MTQNEQIKMLKEQRAVLRASNEEIPSNSRKSDKNLQGLTWQDIKRIVNIADEIIDDRYKDSYGVLWDEEGYYTEVLEEFNEGK